MRVLLDEDNAFYVHAVIEGEIDIKGPRLLELLAVTECPDIEIGAERARRSEILAYADAFRAVATAAEARAKLLEEVAAGSKQGAASPKGEKVSSMEVVSEEET
jgi:hypothetical protein